MRTIKAVPLSKDKFSLYGEYCLVYEPQGHALQGETYKFYPDRVTAWFNGNVGFSPLVIRKQERAIITTVEYHSQSPEILLPLNDDMIIHVSPSSGSEPDLELTEAFIIPKGTIVKIKPGIWHMAPIPIQEKELYVMAAVSECTFLTDSTVVPLGPEKQIEIIL